MPASEIYIDTSVIGGYFDDEFKVETRRLWELEKEGIYRFVTSVVTIEEIRAAPERVKQQFAATFKADMILQGNEESDELAKFYMDR